MVAGGRVREHGLQDGAGVGAHVNAIRFVLQHARHEGD
jgi:hypothetical protein